MKNKYIEKCFICSLEILPNEGEFIKRDNKTRICHNSCIQTPIISTSQKTNKLSQEVIKRLSDNRLIFYKLLNKKLSIRLHKNPKHIYSSIPDIFIDAFDRFWDKYHTQDLDFESAKMIYLNCSKQLNMFCL